MKKFLIGLAVGAFGLMGNIYAQTWVSVSDIIAGNTSFVRVSGLYANEKINIKLIRPNQSKIDLQSFADDFGVSGFRISSVNLEQAGQYNLIISRDFDNYPTVKNFLVYPGVVSAYRSEIIIDKESIAADGEEVSRLKIIAKDTYGNKIKNTPIKVFSSRNYDFIVVNSKTNEDGYAMAKVSSKIPGVSTISILAGETILFKKPEIVFFLQNNDLVDVGAGFSIGKFLKAQLFDDPTEDTNIAYFSIEDLPQEASVGENLTAKIVAKDENGKTVVNYTGTVRFSSSDDRAILPNDYTFPLSDQGIHDFYLAITFGTGGEQTLAVHNLDDFRISGEQSLNIALDSSPIEIGGDPKLTIDIPTSGSSFNAARVTISGTAQQCSIVKLIDGQITLIDNLAINDSGKFVYQTPSLADGTHIFQAICMDDEELISNKVSISIDRTPPQVMSVETIPEGPFSPGENIAINIDGEELSVVSTIFNEQVFNLSKNEQGKFTTNLVVPNKEGDYPLEVTVSDLLGNSVTEPNAAVLSVIEPVEEEITEPENIPPTAVTNLSSKSGNEKVTLFWSPATDDQGISGYKIIFAKLPNNGVFNQESIVPDDRTQWYIDDLESGKEYAFKVIAIDFDNNESVASAEVRGAVLSDENEIKHAAPPKTPESGNNSIIAIIIAIISGLAMIIFSRKEETN